MTWLAGLDGRRGGWVVALIRTDLSTLEVRSIDRLEEVLGFRERPAVVGVDMPIGLLEAARRGGRVCDPLARRRLGRRASCVFSPPARPALEARTWLEAMALNRASSGDGVGLSKEAFNLFPKLCEVDAFMTPERQRRFREVHPEVSFAELAGPPCRFPKKTGDGRAERRERIARQGLPDPSPWLSPGRRRELGAGADDILDAVAAAWSAWRIWRGTALRLPETPAIDARGLAMEILA